MTIDRRVLASALGTLLLVAACGGSSATTAPSTAPAATSAPAPATEAPAPTEETATPETTEAPQPTGPDVSLVPGAAGDLEAKLPSEVAGVKFEKTSFDGSSLPGAIPIGDTEMEKFLKDNGKGLQDVRVAIASPAETSSTAAGSLIMALQVRGVPSDKLLGFATSSLDSSAEKSTVGGKEVYGQVAPGIGGAYFYVKDDVIYYVVSFGGPANLAEEIVKSLP